jgi:predicted small secreted protein
MAKALSCTRPVRAEVAWWFGLIAMLFMISATSGCNTVEGVGKDVSAGGRAMSNTAEETKEKM